VPSEQLDAAVKQLTDMILARSQAAIRIGKQTFYRQLDPDLQPAYELASDTMACNMLLEDAAEGIDAFLQKRPAHWRDR
jgi:enoyl-CoA hydratase/carnithine racemase